MDLSPSSTIDLDQTCASPAKDALIQELEDEVVDDMREVTMGFPAFIGEMDDAQFGTLEIFGEPFFAVITVLTVKIEVVYSG